MNGGVAASPGVRRVDLRDARVVKVAEQLGLDLEPALDGARHEFAAEHLQGDDPRGMLLVGEVHDAGRAGTNLTNHDEVADDRAGRVKCRTVDGRPPCVRRIQE